MNDIRRKLMAYYSNLNQDENMKPCVVQCTQDNYNNVNVTAVYCDDILPSTEKEKIKFLSEHVLILVLAVTSMSYQGNISTTTYYIQANTDGTGYIFNLSSSMESKRVAFTGSKYDWNA